MRLFIRSNELFSRVPIARRTSRRISSARARRSPTRRRAPMRTARGARQRTT